MEKICGIYKITSPTGKIYIGQSRDILKRIKYYNKQYCKCQTKLYHSIKKHGWNTHVFEIIHKCCESELNELDDIVKLRLLFNFVFVSTTKPKTIDVAAFQKNSWLLGPKHIL